MPGPKREWINNQDGPAAKALQREWDSLKERGVWNPRSMRCWYSVANEAKRNNKKAHLAALLVLCVVKNDELPEGHPLRKHKGRVCLLGNRVTDEALHHAQHAGLKMQCESEASLLIGIQGSAAIWVGAIFVDITPAG